MGSPSSPSIRPMSPTERAGLNEAAMETLVLRVQEGLDQEAIARHLGTSESDVSSTLERAFERLRGLAPREVRR